MRLLRKSRSHSYESVLSQYNLNIRVFSKIDYYGITARNVLEQNKFSKKSHLEQGLNLKN